MDSDDIIRCVRAVWPWVHHYREIRFAYLHGDRVALVYNRMAYMIDEVLSEDETRFVVKEYEDERLRSIAKNRDIFDVAEECAEGIR